MIRENPDEHVRNKSLRLNRLKDQCETYAVKLREACTEEEEAGKRADALRDKICANRIEIQQLRAKTRILQNGRPADMATVVETMRKNYEQHFANPSLSEGISGKKAEVEAAFVSMAELLRQLAVFDVTLKACTEQAAAAAAAPTSSTALVATTPAQPRGQAGLSSTDTGEQGGVDARTTGQKAVRDNTDEELLVRRRAVRTKTITDGSTGDAIQAWEPDI